MKNPATRRPRRRRGGERGGERGDQRPARTEEPQTATSRGQPRRGRAESRDEPRPARTEEPEASPSQPRPRRGRAASRADQQPTPEDVAQLLARVRSGDAGAHREIFETLYDNLRSVAHAAMMHEPPGQTLEPTALVHEVFLSLVRRSAPWSDRRHFFAVAACAMRHVLVDHARSRKRRRSTLTDENRRTKSVLVEFEDRAIDLIALDDALQALGAGDERAARVVELRFFGGLTLPQVARTLSLPLRTVERDWQWARAYLHAQLS